MNRARADAVLLFVALLWGTTMVAQKSANAHIGPILFVGIRFGAAALILLPLALWESRRPNLVPLQRADWISAAWIGVCQCLGCWMQQIGLQTTSATNTGFFTAVYIVLVPFVAWILTRKPPRTLVLVAGIVALYGVWLLGSAEGTGQLSRGDWIIMASDLVWAAHITLIGHCVGIARRPILLSFLQCALTGIVSLPIALAWQPATPEALLAALPAIVYAGILSSGLAFTLQIIAQRHTPAAEAALIMSLEAVFAALAGSFVLGEMLSLRAAIGASLILVSVVLVEAGPLMLASAVGRLRPSALRE